MLKNHDLRVILAPKSHLISLIFRTNSKVSSPNIFLFTTDAQTNLFEIMKAEIHLSRFGYILAAITVFLNFLNFEIEKIP